MKSFKELVAENKRYTERVEFEVPAEYEEDASHFIGAASRAHKQGKKEFKLGGKTYPVTIKKPVTEDKYVVQFYDANGDAARGKMSEFGTKEAAKAYIDRAKKVLKPGQGSYKMHTIQGEMYEGFQDDLKKKIGRASDEPNTKNNYMVKVDGKDWKVFANKSTADRAASTLRDRGKKTQVFQTMAPVGSAKKKDSPPFDPDPKKPQARNSDGTPTSGMSKARQLAKQGMKGMKKESVELEENKNLIKDYQGMKAQGKKDSNILDALMSMPKYKRMSKNQMAKIIGDAKRKGIFKESVELDEAMGARTQERFQAAERELAQYAQKSGGVDKHDMMMIAKMFGQIGRVNILQSGQILGQLNRKLSGMDTDPRDKIYSILKKHGLMESVESENLIAESKTPDARRMAMSQLRFIKYAADEIAQWMSDGGEMEEWYQNKLAAVTDRMKGLHAYAEGDRYEDGDDEDEDDMEEVYESYKKMDEKAVSPEQQKLMALALMYKRGKLPDDKASDQVKKLADSMSEKDLEDFAKTKHSEMPKQESRDVTFSDYLSEEPKKIDYLTLMNRVKELQSHGHRIEKKDVQVGKSMMIQYVDKDGIRRKLTMTQKGQSYQNLGPVSGHDDEGSPTDKPKQEPEKKRGRGRPAGSKSGARV